MITYTSKSYARAQQNNKRLELVLATGHDIWLIAFISNNNKKVRTKAFVNPYKVVGFIHNSNLKIMAILKLEVSEQQPINIWGSWESLITKELEAKS